MEVFQRALILCLARCAAPAMAVQPIWYSEDGVTWYEAQNWGTLQAVECVPGVTGCDSFARKNQIVIVHPDEQQAEVVYVRYERPSEPEPVPDPVPEPVPEISTQQLLGLLTRVENLLTTENPRSAFGTAAAMMADRDELMLRVERLREIVRGQ
ncbi:hypothetical protein [Methylophaga lonarensis]|uniref:hypothetical protein n=1 Tax=Methylophaga lonarensis TaxID=999151 RepID=UPI003D288820